MVAGFSHETIDYLWAAYSGQLSSSQRQYRQRPDTGRGGVVGCNNVRTVHEFGAYCHDKEILQERCSRLDDRMRRNGLRQGGLLHLAAREYAGAGLMEVCETVGIPPVSHGLLHRQFSILIADGHGERGWPGRRFIERTCRLPVLPRVDEREGLLSVIFVCPVVLHCFWTTWRTGKRKGKW